MSFSICQLNDALQHALLVQLICIFRDSSLAAVVEVGGL